MPEVNWDDPSIQKPQSNGGNGGGQRREIVQFKGIKDHTQRILLIDKAAIMVKQHWIKKVGKYVRCIHDTNNGYCPACEELGDPTQLFAANVIVYDTNRDGSIIRDPNTGQPVFWLAMWKFGADKFVYIRDLKREWGDLRKHDLIISCTEEQFQKLTIVPAASALWLQDPALQQAVVDVYKNNKYDLEKILGKSISAEDIKAMLGGSVPSNNQQGNPNRPQQQSYQQQPQQQSYQQQPQQPYQQQPQQPYQQPQQQQRPAPPPQSDQGLGVPDLDGPVNTPPPQQPYQQPQQQRPAAPPQQPTPPAQIPTMDFDSLLDEL